MLKHFIIYLFFAFYANADVYDEISRFTEEYGNLNGRGYDALKKLKDVVDHTPDMLYLGRTMSALVKKALDVDFDSESEEQRALIKLYDDIEHQFAYYDERIITEIEKPLIRDEIYREYLHEVIKKLNVLSDLFLEATDPKTSRIAVKDVFNATCTNFTSRPMGMLDLLNKYFIWNCSIPNARKIKIFLETQKALRHLKMHVLKERLFHWSQDYDDVVKRILEQVTLLEYLEAEALVEELKCLLTARKTLFFKFHSVILKFLGKKTKNTCLLDVINIAHNYERLPLLFAVEEFTIDLLKTQLFTMACANISTNGNEVAMDQIMNEMTEKTRIMGNHIILWAQAAQDLSWPEVSIEAAQIRLENEDISVELFNETARIIEEEFSIRGSQHLSYHVIVARTQEHHNFWSVLTSQQGIYTNFTNFKGIDCHIVRYKLGEWDRAQKEEKWFEKKRHAIWNKLLTDRNSANATQMLIELNKTVGPLVQDKLYRSVIIFRNETFSGKKAVIDIGKAGWVVGPFRSTSIIDVFVNDFIVWRVYFMH